MADSITESDIAEFCTNTASAIHSTYHTVLKTSPGAATFGWNMLLDISFLGNCSKIWEYRQKQTDNYIKRENNTHIGRDYQPGDKVLLQKDGVLCKTENQCESNLWTITSVHTNSTIRLQCETKSER